jgi:hypothetical protein
MSDQPKSVETVNEVLLGAALVSIVTLHSYMLFLLVRGRAKLDGIAPARLPQTAD